MDMYEQNFLFKMRFLRFPRQKKPNIFTLRVLSSSSSLGESLSRCPKCACVYCSALIFRGLPHNNGHNSCFLQTMLSSTVLAKMSQTTCGFCGKQCPTRKIQFLFFKNFLLVLTKFNFGSKTGHLAINLQGFGIFLIFPNFPRS